MVEFFFKRRAALANKILYKYAYVDLYIGKPIKLFSTLIVVKYFNTGCKAAKKACHVLLILTFSTNLFWYVGQRRKKDVKPSIHKIKVTHFWWSCHKKYFLKKLVEFNNKRKNSIN